MTLDEFLAPRASYHLFRIRNSSCYRLRRYAGKLSGVSADRTINARVATRDRNGYYFFFMTQQQNDLYLAVLPLPSNSRVLVIRENVIPQGQQILTLFPDRKWATEFFPDEVDRYLDWFRAFAKSSLTSGHVQGYDYQKEALLNGRLIVKVTQYVG